MAMIMFGFACGDDGSAVEGSTNATGADEVGQDNDGTGGGGEESASVGSEESPGSEADTVDDTTGSPPDGSEAGDDDTEDGDAEQGDVCVMTTCAGEVYQCGDCVDNDQDGLIDAADLECSGPCDNNEAGFKGNIPGQAHTPCTVMDCYFDPNSGSDDDGCRWSHGCDPSDPNPSACTFDPDAQIPGGMGLSCEAAELEQSMQCTSHCGPLTPNGCDCFGCCEITVGDVSHTVYLGTGEDLGTCSMATLGDPDKCAPCKQVPACLNTCEADACELCMGQQELAEGCDAANCPAELESCDPANHNSDCPANHVCITGCCIPAPP